MGSGWEMYATAFRNYDPQIGRFHQIDPLAIFSHEFSPYAYANDNPVLFNDPLGLIADANAAPVEAWWGSGVGTGTTDEIFGDEIDRLLNTPYGGTIDVDENGGWTSTTFENEEDATRAGGDRVSDSDSWGKNGATTKREFKSYVAGKYGADYMEPVYVVVGVKPREDGGGQGGSDPGPLKRLTDWEIRQLEKLGWNHGDKDFGGRSDLWKDGKGNIYERARNGTGEAEETGYTIQNGTVSKIVQTAGIAAAATFTIWVLWKTAEFLVTIPACGGWGVITIVNY